MNLKMISVGFLVAVSFLEFVNGSVRCEAPPTTTGPCHNSMKKYFYSSELQECIMFHWGGCQRTPNLFDNELECEALCMGLGQVI